MKTLFLLLLLAPVLATAQKKDTDNIYGTTTTWNKKAPHPGLKMARGGAMIAAGTAITAGALIYSMNITKNEEKTVIYVGAGVGAALGILGGIIMGSAGKEMMRSTGSAKVRFTGNAIAIRL